MAEIETATKISRKFAAKSVQRQSFSHPACFMIRQCPECFGKVSDSATHCPHCGYKLRKYPLGSLFSWVQKATDNIVEHKRKEDEKKYIAEIQNSTGHGRPYTGKYKTLPYAPIRFDLHRARSYSDLCKALAPFGSILEGYRENLEWYKIYCKADPWQSNYIHLLFAAHCVGDERTIRSIVSEGLYLVSAH